MSLFLNGEVAAHRHLQLMTLLWFITKFDNGHVVLLSIIVGTHYLPRCDQPMARVFASIT